MDRLRACRVPVCVDVVHNNNRSKFFAYVTFGLAAVLVTIFIVIALSSESQKTVRIRFWNTPAPDQVFGEKFPLFMVRLINERGTGIEGATLKVEMFPSSPMPLTITLNQQQVSTRTIDCDQYFANPYLPFQQENQAMCNPASIPGALVGNELVTDKDGMAYFYDFSIQYGFPTDYIVQVSHNLTQTPGDINPRFVTSPVRMTSQLAITGYTNGNGPSGNTTGGSNATGAPNGLPTVSGNSVTIGETVGTSALTLSVFLNQKTNATCYDRPLIASFVSLYFSPNQLFIPGLEMIDTTVTDYSVTSSNTYSYLECTSQVKNPDGTYNITGVLTFTNASVTSAATDRMFPAYYFLGQLRTLYALESPAVSPSTLLLPLLLTSPVSSVVAPSLALFDQTVPFQQTITTVVEGAVVPNVTIRVTDGQGQGVPGQVVYAFAQVAQNLNYAVLNVPYEYTAAVDPKSLLVIPSDPTNSNGETTFSKFTFSSSGAVGNYTVTFVCNGVRSPQYLFSVVSSVNFGLLTFQNLVDNETIIYAGQPWPSAPSVRVVGGPRNQPIPGKRAYITGWDYPTQGYSLTSTQDGWIQFTNVLTFFILQEGTFQHAIIIDGVRVAFFTRRTQWPRSLSGSIIGAGKCATVVSQLANTSGNPMDIQYWDSNVPRGINMTALDVTGTPIATDLYFGTTTPGIFFRAVGTGIGYNSNGLVGPFRSSAYGPTTYTILVGGSVTPQYFTADAYCENKVFPSILLIRPRVRSLSISGLGGFYNNVDGSYRNITVTIDADWTKITPETPLLLNLTYLSYPKWILTNYQLLNDKPSYIWLTGWPGDLPSQSAGPVSVNVPLSVVGLPGLYTFFAVAENAVSANYNMTMIPPITNFDLSISQSWATGLPSLDKLQNGRLLPQVPVVRLTYKGTNQPAPGYLMFAEVGQVIQSNGSTTVNYRNFWQNPATDLVYGSAVNILSSGIGPATSIHTDINGEARFSSLSVAGLKPGGTYKMRYVLAAADALVGSTIVAVEETATLTVPVTDIFTPQIITPLPSSAAVGASLTFTIALTRADGSFLPGLVGYPYVPNLIINQPDCYRVFGTPICGIATNNGRLTIGGFSFDSNTKLGTYTVYVALPGVIVPVAAVSLTSAAYAVNIVQQPPDSVLVGQPFTVGIQVVLASGVGLSGAEVGISIVTASSNCGPNARFKFLPTYLPVCPTAGLNENTLQCITGSDGQASCTISIDAAIPGSFQLVFTVIPPNTAAAAASEIQGLSFLLGQPSSQLTAAEIPNAPEEFVASLQLPTQSQGYTGASSDPFNQFSQLKPVSGSSVSFTVKNQVAQVIIFVQPEINIPFVGLLPISFSRQPIVKLLDVEGNPVVNATVSVIAVLDDGVTVAGSNVLAFTSTAGNASDAYGFYNFSTITVTGAIPGYYRLVFICNGISSNASNVFQVPPNIHVDLSTQMKLFSLLVMICFVPIFISNAPLESPAWFFPALAIAITLFVFGLMALLDLTSVFKDNTQNPFLKVHLGVGEGAVVLLLLIMSVILIFFAIRQVCKKSGLPLNDASRATRAYKYAQWLLWARLPKKTQQEWLEEEQEDISDHNILWKLRFFFEKKTKRKYQAPAIIPLQPVRTRTKFHPKLECPKEKQFIDLPVRFGISIAVFLVMYEVLFLFTLWLFDQIRLNLDKIIGWFGLYAVTPYAKYTTAKGQAQDQATQLQTQFATNDEIQSALTGGVNFLVSQGGQQYQPLLNILPLLQSIDIAALLQEVGTFFHQLNENITTAQILGMIGATLAVFGTIVSLILVMPKIIMDIRRGGKQYGPHLVWVNLQDADRYVGLQAMHLVLQYLLTFFMIVGGYLALATPDIRDFLFSQIKILLTFGVISIVVFKLISLFIVEIFWVNGMVVVRNFFYMPWSIVAMLWFVFNAIFHTVLRLIVAIVVVFCTFARVDLGVVPLEFQLVDLGHMAFYSMLAVNARYCNPVMWSFCGHLLFLNAVKKELELGNDIIEDVDAFAVKTARLPHIQNVIRYIAHEARGVTEIDLDAYPDEDRSLALVLRRNTDSAESPAEAIRRRSKLRLIQARFWMWTLLTLHPSLQKLRKFRLVPQLEMYDDLIGKKLAAAGVRGGSSSASGDGSGKEDPPLIMSHGVSIQNESKGNLDEQMLPLKAEADHQEGTM